jgi:hypothetical protein
MYRLIIGFWPCVYFSAEDGLFIPIYSIEYPIVTNPNPECPLFTNNSPGIVRYWVIPKREIFPIIRIAMGLPDFFRNFFGDSRIQY